MNARAIFPATAKRYRIARRPSESIRPSSPRSMRRDCHGRLLTDLLGRAGEQSDIIDSSLTAWASATFIGARHVITLLLQGEDAAGRAQALSEALPDAEFRIAGHIVADLSVDKLELQEGLSTLTLSILTIEAW